MGTWEEFKDQLTNQQMVEYFRCINIDMSEARNIFNILDVHDEGTLSNQEFVAGCLKLRGPARALDLERLSFLTRQLALRTTRELTQLSLLVRALGQPFDVDLDEVMADDNVMNDLEAREYDILAIGRQSKFSVDYTLEDHMSKKATKCNSD